MTIGHRGGAGGPVQVSRHHRARWAAVGALTLVVGLTGCSDAHHHEAAAADRSSSSAYGTLPSFLPKDTIRPDSMLIGQASRPALTTEGDAVDVRTGGVSVRATVAGPVVPGEGLPVQTEATTCTWTITLSHASARVPIRLTDFTGLDHLGAVYRVAAVPGQPAVPTSIAPGSTVTFEVRAVMPTGEGLMRWAPGGGHILASWDFEVEND